MWNLYFQCRRTLRIYRKENVIDKDKRTLTSFFPRSFFYQCMLPLINQLLVSSRAWSWWPLHPVEKYGRRGERGQQQVSFSFSVSRLAFPISAWRTLQKLTFTRKQLQPRADKWPRAMDRPCPRLCPRSANSQHPSSRQPSASLSISFSSSKSSQLSNCVE